MSRKYTTPQHHANPSHGAQPFGNHIRRCDSAAKHDSPPPPPFPYPAAGSWTWDTEGNQCDQDPITVSSWSGYIHFQMVPLVNECTRTLWAPKYASWKLYFQAQAGTDQTPPHYPFSLSLFLLPLDILKPHRSRLKYPRNHLLPPQKKKYCASWETKPWHPFWWRNLLHLITRMKMRGRETRCSWWVSTLTSHHSTTQIYSYKWELWSSYHNSGSVYPRNELLEMCKCDPNNLMKRDPGSGSVVVVVQLVVRGGYLATRSWQNANNKCKLPKQLERQWKKPTIKIGKWWYY
jgi:hypothetical protein